MTEADKNNYLLINTNTSNAKDEKNNKKLKNIPLSTIENRNKKSRDF